MIKNNNGYDIVALYIIAISSFANIILTILDYSNNGHVVTLLTMIISTFVLMISLLRLIKEKKE